MKSKKALKIAFVLILAFTIWMGSIVTFADEINENREAAVEETVDEKEAVTEEAEETQEQAELELTPYDENADLAVINTEEDAGLTASLAAPVLTSEKSVADGIKISWTAVENAVKYYVYRKSGNSSWIKIAEPTTNYYTDNTCDYGSLYTYTVRAVSKSGKLSGYDKSGIRGAFVPMVTISSLKNNQKNITVKWKKIKCADGYKVYRREDGTKDWTAIATTSSTSYADSSNLSKGKVYEYVVRAYVKIKKVKYYGFYSGSIIKETTRLTVPKLAVQSVEKGTKISWKTVKGAAQYYVYMKAGSRWAQIGTTKETSFVYTDAPAGIVETYTVVALDKNGNCSSYNRSGCSTAYIPLTKITSIANTVDSDNATEYIAIKWNKVGGATGYRLFRKAEGGSWKVVTTTKKTYYNDKKANKSGVKYTYAVRPLMTVGSKVYLSAYDSSRNKAVICLSAPVLTKVSCKNNSVKTKWNAVTGAESYRVYRKTAKSSWKLLDTVTKTSYSDTDVLTGTRYYYTIRAVGSTGDLSGFHKAKLNDVYYPTNNYKYYELPEKRYLNLGWNVDPRDSWGPADYCKSPTTWHGTLMTNSDWWTYHNTYGGDTYKPQAGDIITYGIPDSNGDTYEHVDICVKGYDSTTGNFAVITGNWSTGSFTTSPIAYVEKSWEYYTSKLSFGSSRICNIWQCKLPTSKKHALINTAWGMLEAYEQNPDETRQLILDCKYNNWCDVFVSYVIYVAR